MGKVEDTGETCQQENGSLYNDYQCNVWYLNALFVFLTHCGCGLPNLVNKLMANKV